MEISKKCLELVKRLGDRGDHSTIPGSVRYAIRNWTQHLATEGIASGEAIFGDDEGFSRLFASVTALRKSDMTVSGDYWTHMYDPRQGFPPHAPFHFSHSFTFEGDQAYVVEVSMDGGMSASANKSGDIS